MKIQELSYIILTFILISIFIATFFFTYVAKVESDIIKTQINDSIENFVKSSTFLLSPEQKENVGEIILNNLSIPDMTKDDDDTAKNNKELINKSLIFFSILFGIGIIIIFSLWLKFRFDLYNVIKYSIIVLTCIAFTEFLFVTHITKNYVLIDQNYLNFLVIDNLEKYKNS